MFGQILNQNDSALMRTALGDPDVKSVTFFPAQEGHAVYEALEYFLEDSPELGPGESCVVLKADTDKFKAAFQIVLEHDYPSEFNDKFFVELTPADTTDETVRQVAAAILALYPTATSYGVSSSDQGYCGYLLTQVGFADDTVITHDSDRFTELANEQDDELRNLSWGAFGDTNADSAFDVDISTGRIIR